MLVIRQGTYWRSYLDLVKQSGAAWVDDRAPTMGAALAFYSAFALAPLLIVLIAVAGAIFGPDAARGAIAGQLTGLVGAPAAQAIQDLLKAAQETTTGALATVIGLVTMLVGATTVLVELQDDLDLIWKAPRRAGSNWLSILRARALSLGLILAIGFLLLISLVISSAVSALGVYSESFLPGAAVVLMPVWNTIFSLGAVTVLFAMLYKWLPNVPIAWQDVWIGAFITAVLFTLGRSASAFTLVEVRSPRRTAPRVRWLSFCYGSTTPRRSSCLAQNLPVFTRNISAPRAPGVSQDRRRAFVKSVAIRPGEGMSKDNESPRPQLSRRRYRPRSFTRQ